MKGRVASLLEVGTGMHPEMTARQNIYLNGSLMGMRRNEISDKLEDIVSFAGIEKYIDTPVKRFSSGMKVRLGFAVAAFLEPEILIVDEVLAVGDAEFQTKAIGKMQEVSKGGGRTVLFVSHNMAAVQNLCTRCVILKDGQIKNIGGVKKMIDEYLEDGNKVHEIVYNKKEFKSTYESFIKSICFIDSKTEVKKGSFKMGEDITLVIKVYNPEKLDNLGINVRMDDKESVQIVGWRTKEMGIKVPISNSFEVKLLIQNLNVFDGHYKFSLALLNGNEMIDFHDSVLHLEITPAEIGIFNKVISKSHNLIYHPCEWKFIEV